MENTRKGKPEAVSVYFTPEEKDKLIKEKYEYMKEKGIRKLSFSEYLRTRVFDYLSQQTEKGA